MKAVKNKVEFRAAKETYLITFGSSWNAFTFVVLDILISPIAER